ncbi:hypothetical protein ACFL6I_20000 [candidate division KSB1 bacterium]
MEKEEITSPKENRSERELAAISYLSILSVIVLLSKRDSVFIQHHARRGFVLFLLSILFWAFPALHYGEFLILVLMILGFIKAAIGEENALPVLSEIADGTLRFRHLKHYWHHTKHGAIKMVKPDHIPPALEREIREEKRELSEQEKLLEKEKHMLEMEEKKLSSLFHRVSDDEKRIDQLSDEVHHLEEEVEEIKK